MTGQRIDPVRYATHPQQRPNRVAVPTKATTPPGLPIPVEPGEEPGRLLPC